MWRKVQESRPDDDIYGSGCLPRRSLAFSSVSLNECRENTSLNSRRESWRDKERERESLFLLEKQNQMERILDTALKQDK